MAFIEFRDIHKYFGEAHVLKGINLDIEEGEFVTLLGPSGCGKSTLLRCFSGLESVTEGEIYLAGTNITNFTPKQRKISMVFQQYSLFPNMTVGQNVAFGLQMQKKKKNYIQEKVKETLDIVGLSEKIDQYPRELSGGQQQRVALARAIIVEPRVLLLDEPLSAIDALLRRNLQVEIRKIQQKLKITTIFVTHDQEEAMVMSDTIHLFNLGKIEQSGTPREITAAGLWAAACIGLALGAGFYSGAIIGFVAIWLSLGILSIIDSRIYNNSKVIHLYIEFENITSVSSFISKIREKNGVVRELETTKVKGADGKNEVSAVVELRFSEKKTHSEIIEEFGKSEGVLFIEKL